MPLFQPTNVMPSSLSGVGAGTIDATKPMEVSWQVNGTSAMTDYQIIIMQNDTASTQVLDTGKVTLAHPFWGADRMGNPVMFSTVISAAQLSTAGIVNGYENGYKFKIKQWWSANDSIEQTSANYFITREEPRLFFLDGYYHDQFLLQECTFKAMYDQSQGDMIEWNRWELQILIDGKYETVDDTGAIFGAELGRYGSLYEIYYTYNGFIIGVEGNIQGQGMTYRLRCTVQTENGVQKETDWKYIITEDINTFDPGLKLILCRETDTDAVRIQFPTNYPVQGEATGEYTYQSVPSQQKYSIALSEGASVKWGVENRQFSGIPFENVAIVTQFEIPDASVPCTFMIVKCGAFDIEFSYAFNGMRITRGEETLWGGDYRITPSDGANVTIALSNNKVYACVVSGGVYSYATNDTQAALPFKDTIEGIQIFGRNTFNYVWALRGGFSQSVFNYASIPGYNPSYEEEDDTEFLAAFNGTLYTGSFSSMREYIVSHSIYRREKGSSLFKFIANIPLERREVMDYSALSQKSYEYYFLNMDDIKRARSRNGISEISPCFWNYTVLCCQKANSGDYVVESEYRFALDVASGSVGNNNSPTFLQNFTKYPMRQPVSNNYRSGTLSAFIGKVQDGQYVDTTNLMDELYQLSNNPLTKFLKTRKGQIFQIETGAPVVMQIGDKYAAQPAKISLPWVEVGDATNANILGAGNAASGVPQFHADPETMELTMEYSPVSEMGAQSFSLVDADLYLNDPGVYNTEDFSLDENKEVILKTE